MQAVGRRSLTAGAFPLTVLSNIKNMFAAHQKVLTYHELGGTIS